METLFQSDEFKQYQELLAENLTTQIMNLLVQGKYAEMAGVMKFVNAVLQTPAKRYPKNENIKLNSKRAMANFKTKFVIRESRSG